MEIREKACGSVTILCPSGRIDAAHSEAFQTRLVAAVGRSAAQVVVDMADISYISSVGLRALMVAAKQTKATGGKLAVAGLQPVVLEIFEISRFNFVVKIFATVREAIAWMSPDAAAAWDAAQTHSSASRSP